MDDDIDEMVYRLTILLTNHQYHPLNDQDTNCVESLRFVLFVISGNRYNLFFFAIVH